MLRKACRHETTRLKGENGNNDYLSAGGSADRIADEGRQLKKYWQQCVHTLGVAWGVLLRQIYQSVAVTGGW